MPPANQTRKIAIVVDASGAEGLKGVADKIGGINKNTKAMADGFKAAGFAAVAFLSYFSARQLTSFSDEIQVLNNRLLVMTGTQEQASILLGQLQGVARDTNTSISDTSETFLKLGLATQAAHLPTEVLLDLTKTLTNTFRLSGASADEASTAVKSLALGFQQGSIQGRELRTILRQNTVLANLLRAEFGSNLKSDAQLGFLTVGKLMGVLQKNMVDINTQAVLLSATFGQNLTKVLDSLKVTVFDLTSALGLQGGLSFVVQILVYHMDALLVAVVALSTAALPTLITRLYATATAITRVQLAALGLVAGLTIAVALFGDSWNVKALVLQMEAGFARIQAGILDTVADFYELLSKFALGISALKDMYNKISEAARASAADHRTHAQALNIEEEAAIALAKAQVGGKATTTQWAAAIDSANKNLKGDTTAKEWLAELNREFLSNSISLAKYNEEILKFDLKKATKEARDGSIDIGKLHDAFRAVDIANINRQFKDGALTIDEFNTKIRAVGLAKLNEDLEAGKISLSDYNSKLAAVSDKFSSNGAFRTGLQDYLNSIGTTTQQVATAITSAFKGVEDVFIELIQTGTANFAKFTQSVLTDLERIIIRAAVIQPLATGLLGALTPNGGKGTVELPASNIGDGGIVAAKGYAFGNGNVLPFARGGVVSSPTLFGYGDNKVGMMGEAGHEAILPLARGGSGELGVKASVTPVTININNTTPAEVKTTESTGPSGERMIEVLIQSKVRDGIASGSFDKIMQQSYGLKRKGS